MCVRPHGCSEDLMKYFLHDIISHTWCYLSLLSKLTPPSWLMYANFPQKVASFTSRLIAERQLKCIKGMSLWWSVLSGTRPPICDMQTRSFLLLSRCFRKAVRHYGDLRSLYIILILSLTGPSWAVFLRLCLTFMGWCQGESSFI